MSAHAYTNDQHVEPPALGLFAELGWITVSALRKSPSKNADMEVDMKPD